MITSTIRRRSLATAIVLALGTLALAPPVAAQSPDQANNGSSSEEEATTLSTITVTAQKREQKLQDVPIAVTTLSSDLLQDAGVHNIKDLQLLVPGMTVTSTTNKSQTTARIRGIGTVGDNPGLESSVGVVIDGVYRPRNGVGFGDLGRIKRIEILKGPQGTVFGKNTSAGVINIITMEPYFETDFRASLTFGNYNARGFTGWFNTPLSDAAAFSIYFAKRERDGFMQVETGQGPRTTNDDYTRDYHTVRAQLLLEPSYDLSVRFIADATSKDELCCTAVTIARDNTAGLPFNAPAAILGQLVGGNAVTPVVDPGARTAWSNRGTSQDIEDQGISAEVNWNTPWFGGATLTSITAVRNWKALNARDYDFTTADLVYRNGTEDEGMLSFNTLSQELRFAGGTDSFNWMVGAFFVNEDLKNNVSYSIGQDYEPYLSSLIGGQVLGQLAAQLAPLGITVDTSNPALFLSQVAGVPYGSFVGLGSQDRHRQEANSVALFTNNTWHINDALNFTFGLRYTRESKSLDSYYTNPNGGMACGSLLANPTGRVAAALMARGIPIPALPPAVQKQILGAVVPTLVGYTCLPWANVLHNGRVVHQELENNSWSGTLKLDYHWADNIMTYVSAARGHKAGGFNLDRVQSSNGLSSGGAGIIPVDDTSFPAEVVDSYELGAKTTWAGGNLLLNATLFYQKYADFQLNAFLGTSYRVRSIPEVVSQGVEAQLLWQTPLDGLLFRSGVLFADTQYGDQPIPGDSLDQLRGQTIGFAPERSATMGINYEWNFGGSMSGYFSISAKYMSDYNTGSDLDPEKIQEAYTVANARLGFGARDDTWKVELWSKNITDEVYKQVGFDAPIQPGAWNAFMAPPRTYGVTFRMDLY